jgi:hypothetical protein
VPALCERTLVSHKRKVYVYHLRAICRSLQCTAITELALYADVITTAIATAAVVLQVVGQTAIIVCAFSLAPFIVMVLWGKGARHTLCMHADVVNCIA